MILKGIGHLARIAEPRQVRANRAAYQDILLYRHDQLVPVEYLLQDVLKYHRFMAQRQKISLDFIYLIPIGLYELLHILL